MISELRERIHVRHEPRHSIVLSIARSQLLRYIGKQRGGSQYDDLAASLERLCATHVKTNLPLKMTGGKVQSFALLERYEPDDAYATDPVWTITPPEWLVDIVHQDLIVPVHPNSMNLSGIARCVYRYARATIGDTTRCVHLDPARAADRFGATGKGAVPMMKLRLKRLVESSTATEAPGGEMIASSNEPRPTIRKTGARRPWGIPHYTIVASAKGGVDIVPLGVVHLGFDHV